ncbi:proteinase inhibitor I78 [Streptomyces sp. NPDC002889]|uniref:proteinase inhibitor I78 n=1 Tax=Streptomyces sp. NPDC002889 TaxID=3364669 RepID=UPI00369DC942
MAPTPTPPAEPEDAPDSYVGLGTQAAEMLARQRGWTSVRSVPKGAIITMEYMVGRLNFEVEDGTVIRCWKG